MTTKAEPASSFKWFFLTNDFNNKKRICTNTLYNNLEEDTKFLSHARWNKLFQRNSGQFLTPLCKNQIRVHAIVGTHQQILGCRRERIIYLSPVLNKRIMGKPQVVARNPLWDVMRNMNADVMAQDFHPIKNKIFIRGFSNYMETPK